MKLGALLERLMPWRRKPPPAPEPDRPPPPPAPVPSRPDLVFTPFLAESDIAVSLADPALPDQPLIHINDAFCTLTGYAREEVIGTNCRFLQGRLTRRSEADAIRHGIDRGEFVFTRLLNYHRDGTLFDNALQVGPLRDTRGDVRFLFGLQWDVGDTLAPLDTGADEDSRDRSLSPRLRALERQSRYAVQRSVALGEGAAGVPLVERLVALGRAYQFPDAGRVPADRAGLESLLRYLLAPHAGPDGARVRLDGVPGAFDERVAGPLSLWLHELAGTSRRRGALSGAGGDVVLSWGFPTERGRPRIAFHWDEIGADVDRSARLYRPFSAANRVGGHGARVMRELAEFAGGRSVTHARGSTVDATLVLPNDAAVPAG